MKIALVDDDPRALAQLEQYMAFYEENAALRVLDAAQVHVKSYASA